VIWDGIHNTNCISSSIVHTFFKENYDEIIACTLYLEGT
jgi:hypothetical protein